MKNSTQLIPKIFDEALSKKSIFTEALFKRPESLSKMLPYDEYMQEQKIFVLKDGSLGAIFEVELIEHEPKTSKEIIAAVNDLKSWLSLPENCVLQVLYEQAEITERDTVFSDLKASYPDAHPLSKKLFEEKLEGIQKASGTCSDLSVLRRKCYLSVRYFIKERKIPHVLDVLNKDESTLHGEMKYFLKDMRNFIQLTDNLSANSQINLRKIGGVELIEFLRKFFNPKTYYKRSFARFNSNISLESQYTYSSPCLTLSGIEREGIKTRTLTLKTSPSVAYPGGMAYFTKLNFPFRLSLNISFPSKEKTKRFFDLKEFFLQNTPSARAKIQREEILEVQDKLARDDRGLHLTFSVIVEGETDEILDDRTRQVCNIFHSDLECEVIQDNDIGLGLCLNSLPLCYEPQADISSQRFIRILRSDAIKFLPIFDSFRGFKNPVSLFLSRENNLVPFSLLENETSSHTVIVADTGAGKSSFVNDWIQSCKRLSPEPLVFVLDKKSSYTMLAEFFDGDLSIFDRNKDVPFNPFRGQYDEEKIAFLTKLLLTAIQLTSQSFILESEHQSAITQAIKIAYVKKLNLNGLSYLDGEFRKGNSKFQVEITMEDIITELGALNDVPREILETLILKLKPFYHDGIYAKFFRASPSEVTKSKRFFVYDLDALDSDPVLQTLMTMSVFEEIRRIMALPENQGRQSFLIFEEFARQGKNNIFFAEFAIDFAETMRKRNGWIMPLTPRPQNYFETEIGRAFWGVADNFIFLQMNSDNVDYLAKNSSLLDEASLEIVRSLKTIRGKYAEVFYINKKKTKSGAFRSWLFPTGRWMSPSNAKDTKEALNALSKHKDKWEVLSSLAYPSTK